MKVTFISNFLNHHQIPFCNELYKILGKDYKFIATEKVPYERKRLGYKAEFNNYKYYFEAIDNSSIKLALELVYQSDVVIIGSAPDYYIKQRICDNKLIFRYNERLFKDGFINHPGDIIRGLKKHTLYRKKNVYMMCASAYTAPDCKLIFAYPNKMLKWGYFPQNINYNIKELFKKKDSGIVKLLWVGRFLDFKHPDDFVTVCERLKKFGYQFEAVMIGNGQMYDEISKYIINNDLSNNIKLTGSLSPEKVRKYMEYSDIFLFTSDRREGWGAVLNESMNSGCAVIASSEIGSVPYMISDNENGFVYKKNDINELYEKTKLLIESKVLRENLGENAYMTVVNEWNSSVAAERFYSIASQLMKNKKFQFYKSGPLSEG